MNTQKTIIFDSSVWLSYICKNDVNHLRATILFESMPENAIVLMPEIVFYEIIIVLTKLDYLDAIVIFKNFHLKMIPITPSTVFNYTVKYQGLIRCKTQDFLILASCLEYNIDIFETFDVKQNNNYLILKNYENNKN